MQLAIVLYHGMTTLDAIGPYEILRFLPDVDLRFVSHTPGPIMTDSNILTLGATHSFAETPRPDMILLPGSMADTATAMADDTLIAWVKQVHPTTTWTLSVCSGALILAAAGILDGHAATTHWAAQSALRPFGVTPMRAERIVRSGKIVTAAGVSAGLDLALWLFGEIAGHEAARTVQLSIEYDPHPPYDSGHPDKASKTILKQAKRELIKHAKNARDFVSIPKIAWNRLVDKLGS